MRWDDGNRGQETKNQTTRIDLKVRHGVCVQTSRVHWMSVCLCSPGRDVYVPMGQWVQYTQKHKNMLCLWCEARDAPDTHTYKHTGEPHVTFPGHVSLWNQKNDWHRFDDQNMSPSLRTPGQPPSDDLATTQNAYGQTQKR